MKIDHVGVAVESIEAALPFYRDALGLSVTHREEVPGQRVRVAFLGDPAGGGAEVELLEPTGPDGPIGRFLAARGPGMHHLAFKTRDLRGEAARLAGLGFPAIEKDGPRPGARGRQVCFLQPKAAHGVLVELVGHAIARTGS